MSLSKRLAALVLALLMLTPLLITGAGAADKPVVSYDRYDGVKAEVYEGEWSVYSIKVENVPEGAAISYRWQFTMKFAESDADRDACSTEWHVGWFEASELNQALIRNYENSPFMEIYNGVGEADVEDSNRFVFRCTVTVNGTSVKSPVFEQHCKKPETMKSINASDIDVPVYNAHPDFTAKTVSKATVRAVQWVRDYGTYYEMMDANSTFAYTGSYEVRVLIDPDRGQLPVFDGDSPTAGHINGARCRLTEISTDTRTVVLTKRFRIINGETETIRYDYTEDTLLAFDDNHQYPYFDETQSLTDLDVVANSTATFQFAAKELPDGALDAGYSVKESFRWYDGDDWHASDGDSVELYDGRIGRQLNLNAGAVGKQMLVAQILELYKNGVSQGKTLVRMFCTTAVEGLPPRLWRYPKNDVTKNVGESLLLYCKASGGDNRYLWEAYHYVVGRYSSGYRWTVLYSTDNILQFEQVTTDMDGWIFRCRVTNDYGETYSPEITLHVEGIPCDTVELTGIHTPAANVAAYWGGVYVTSGTGGVTNNTVCWARADNPAAAAAAASLGDFESNVTAMEPSTNFAAGATYYAIIYIDAVGDYRYTQRTAVTHDGARGKILYRTATKLVVGFVYTTACNGSNNCPTAKYTDVPPVSSWAHAGIDFCVDSGIMGSTSTDQYVFSPNTACTRAMIVSVLYRLAGSPAVTYEAKFPDVAKGKWYTDAVLWAYRNRIVSGYDNGKFGPDDKITREQMAVILKGYAGGIAGKSTYVSADLSGFADKNKVTWSKDAVSWAVAAGLISGRVKDGKTYLEPQGSATRAEAASILMRFAQKVL